MALKTDTELDARLARVERLSLLAIVERHGLHSGLAVDVQALRSTCLADAQAILQEQQSPLERRAA